MTPTTLAEHPETLADGVVRTADQIRVGWWVRLADRWFRVVEQHRGVRSIGITVVNPYRVRMPLSVATYEPCALLHTHTPDEHASALRESALGESAGGGVDGE